MMYLLLCIIDFAFTRIFTRSYTTYNQFPILGKCPSKVMQYGLKLFVAGSGTSEYSWFQFSPALHSEVV